MAVFKHLASLVAGFMSVFMLAFAFTIVQGLLLNSRTYDTGVFDPSRWQKSEDSNERFTMIKDLEYYYVSNGMSRTELIELLGKPDLTVGDSTVRYHIGSPGPLAPGKDLVFRFNERSVVTDFKIE